MSPSHISSALSALRICRIASVQSLQETMHTAIQAQDQTTSHPSAPSNTTQSDPSDPPSIHPTKQIPQAAQRMHWYQYKPSYKIMTSNIIQDHALNQDRQMQEYISLGTSPPSEYHTSDHMGEKFADTKKHLQAQIGASDKDFAKYRFALIQVATFKQPSYIEDEDTIYDHKFTSEDVLALYALRHRTPTPTEAMDIDEGASDDEGHEEDAGEQCMDEDLGEEESNKEFDDLGELEELVEEDSDDDLYF
ncbi:hypothetical protein DFH29DRAFT_1005117 [Suillus ampliporus]|nr:hypothetical protein DFH29DRAFT_1005117 [Suillus ampliporus]